MQISVRSFLKKSLIIIIRKMRKLKEALNAITIPTMASAFNVKLNSLQDEEQFEGLSYIYVDILSIFFALQISIFKLLLMYSIHGRIRIRIK
jgi:uncharacterized protein Veg